MSQISRLNVLSLVSRYLLLLTIVLAWTSSSLRAGEYVNYHLTDFLGSTVATIDEDANIISRESYQPYGKSEGVRSADYQQSIDSPNHPVGYAGHVEDKDLGLVYMQARYYDPVVGRFLSTDPAGVFGHVRNNPKMFNRYTYANNNPYKYIDSDGEFAHLILGAIAGAAVDVALQGALIATGVQDSFSFKQLAVGTALGAASGGLSVAAKSGQLGRTLQGVASKSSSGSSISKEAAATKLAQTTALVARKKAGFADEGIPLILDNSLGVNSTKLAANLRADGINARSVREIFGPKDPGDTVIRSLAEQIGGRVAAVDRARDVLKGGGFGNTVIQISGRLKNPETVKGLVKKGLKK